MFINTSINLCVFNTRMSEEERVNKKKIIEKMSGQIAALSKWMAVKWKESNIVQMY